MEGKGGCLAGMEGRTDCACEWFESAVSGRR